jgi:hypothetical protein
MYSLEFQRRVLRLLMSDVTFAHQYGSELKPEYFETSPCRILLELIKNHVYTYETPIDSDLLSVKVEEYIMHGRDVNSAMAKELATEARVIAKVDVGSDRSVIESMISFVRRQALKIALYKSVEVFEQNQPYERCIKLIDDAVAVGVGNRVGMEFKDLASLPEIYRLAYDRSKLCTTGFPSWDDCLMGGFGAGELHVCCAPPKSGKTSLGVCIGAANLKAGKVVFHISLEIKLIDLAMKYAMNMTEMTIDDIISENNPQYAQRMNKYNKVKPNLYMNYWSPNTINTTTIRAWITKVMTKTGQKPDIVLIDYDDLLIPSGGKDESMYENSGKIYMDLISLADSLKCPIVTFAQPQRDSWDNANQDKLLKADNLAHSAKKAHLLYSITTLNFTDESDNGILFVDMVRRGKGKTKIRAKRDMSICSFVELESGYE